MLKYVHFSLLLNGIIFDWFSLLSGCIIETRIITFLPISPICLDTGAMFFFLFVRKAVDQDDHGQIHRLCTRENSYCY